MATKKGHTRKGHTKNSSQTVNALVRAEQAVKLRCANLSFQEIADTLKVPISTVYDDVSKAVALLKENIAADTGELRAFMLMQLDAMHKRWWPLAMGISMTPNTAPDKHALDRVLRIMDRKMKLLGLGDTEADPDEDTAARAMRDKAEIYKGMGVAALTRLFAERIKAPIVLQGRLIEHLPTAAQPPDTAGQ